MCTTEPSPICDNPFNYLRLSLDYPLTSWTPLCLNTLTHMRDPERRYLGLPMNVFYNLFLKIYTGKTYFILSFPSMKSTFRPGIPTPSFRTPENSLLVRSVFLVVHVSGTQPSPDRPLSSSFLWSHRPRPTSPSSPYLYFDLALVPDPTYPRNPTDLLSETENQTHSTTLVTSQNLFSTKLYWKLNFTRTFINR